MKYIYKIIYYFFIFGIIIIINNRIEGKLNFYNIKTLTLNISNRGNVNNSKKILDEMYNNAKKPSEREHVTLFVLFQPERYKIFRVDYERDVSKYRFNLDYELDYELLKTIFEKLYFRDPNFTMEDVIRLLEDNPSIYQLNSEIKPFEGMLKSLIEDEKKGLGKSKNFFKKYMNS